MVTCGDHDLHPVTPGDHPVTAVAPRQAFMSTCNDTDAPYGTCCGYLSMAKGGFNSIRFDSMRCPGPVMT